MKGHEEHAMAKHSNVPAVQQPQVHFSLLEMPQNQVAQVLRENLGSEGLSATDLPQVSVPAAGGTMFNIPTIDGPMDMREVVGIIVATKHTRAYWEQSFDQTGGGTPPSCVSEDGERGIGTPGGDCSTCPHAAFGSAPNKRSKACQEKRLIFFVPPDETLPIVVKAPAGSLKNAKSYLMGLTSRGKKLYEVYTCLGLEADKNKDGIKFSKITFRKVGELTDADKQVMHAYAEAIKPHLMKTVRDLAGMRDANEVTE